MIIFILSLIALGIAVLFIANAIYKRTNHFNNQFTDVRKYWDMATFPNNLQVINLGSNHPKFGFDYSEADVQAMNCAVGPQTFEYDFAILRKITSHLAVGAYVLIPVCLLNFFYIAKKTGALTPNTILSLKRIV